MHLCPSALFIAKQALTRGNSDPVEARRLYLFIEGGHPTLKQTRREQLFIELLEILNPEDAKLLCNIKDKKMPYKGITYNLTKEVFPDILP